MAVSEGGRGAVAPPIPVPPRVGLLATLGGAARILADSTRESDGSTRWTRGYAYNPIPCDAGGVFDPCASATIAYDDDAPLVEVEPFGVYATAQCSPWGGEPAIEERRTRALQALAACESKQIANELWTGTLARAATPDWPNPFLASSASDELSVSPVGFASSLACLEQYLAECACGQQGMIHATRQLSVHWASLGLLRREGNLLLTYLDTLVVADAGYDGSGPQQQPAEDGAVWAYASGMVNVRMSQAEVFGADGAGVDRSLNTVSVRAQRLAAYDFASCCHGAIAVDLDVCAMGPAGS